MFYNSKFSGCPSSFQAFWTFTLLKRDCLIVAAGDYSARLRSCVQKFLCQGSAITQAVHYQLYSAIACMVRRIGVGREDAAILVKCIIPFLWLRPRDHSGVTFSLRKWP